MVKCLFITAFIFTSLSLRAQVVHTKNFDRFSRYEISDWITYAPASYVTSVDVGDTYVYFGTRDGGILRYNLYEKMWDFPYTTSSGLRSNHIKDLVFSYVDDGSQNWQSHVLYALTDKGIDEYIPAFEYWRPAYAKSLPPKKHPTSQDIQDFKKQGDFLFPEFYRPKNKELPDFFMERNYMFRMPNEILDSENRIFKINKARVVDTWRTLWIGSNGLGPLSSDLHSLDLHVHPQSISYIIPRDVCLDGDDIWIGGIPRKGRPSGITRWNLQDDSWIYREARFIPRMHNHIIKTIAANKKNVFFGSEDGLIRYNKKNDRWKTFTMADQLESNHVQDLLLLDSVLYIATDGGFNVMEKPFKRILRPSERMLNNTPVYQMTMMDSILLLATRNGLYKYDPQIKDINFFKTKSAILDVNISAVEFKNDTLWFAGRNGITYYDSVNDRWKSFTNIRFYISGKIHDIALSDDMAWFATDSGLLEYDIKQDYWYLYTTEDGLAADKVYKITLDRDELWLSTEGGITIFEWK